MLTTDVDNYPGFPEGILGPELMEQMRKQAERFGTEFATGRRQAGGPRRAPLRAHARRGRACERRHADRGHRRPRALAGPARGAGVPHEASAASRACATCDGFFYKGKDVLVVGGGDTAMEEATFLTKFAAQGHDRAPARRAARLEDHAGAAPATNPKIAWLPRQRDREVSWAAPGKGVTGALVRNLKTRRRDRGGRGRDLHGHRPRAEHRASSRASSRWTRTATCSTHDGTTATSVPGVFAAGDVADHRYRQAVTAAGTGCMAAIDAERFLSH